MSINLDPINNTMKNVQYTKGAIKVLGAWKGLILNEHAQGKGVFILQLTDLVG